MILLDANFLIKLSNKNHESQWLLTFFRSLGTRQVIGIPAPSWAEILTYAGPATAALTKIVHGRATLQIIPFDEIAAIESGYIHQEIVAKSGGKKGASAAPWQKIKIDRQILAIAVARRATAIYTDDTDLRADANLLDIRTIGLDDVTLPPEQLPLLAAEGSDVPETKPSGTF